MDFPGGWALRIVHYINQFFAGVGGEEAAGAPLEEKEGAVGPGRLLEQLMGGDAQVVSTLVCGDNHAVENQDAVVAAVVEKVRAAKADLFVAGPCFEAGRYGMISGAACVAVEAELGIPAMTGMHVENPGVDLYREGLYIVDSGQSAAKMTGVMGKIVAIAQKRLKGEPIGKPGEAGYLARGLILDAFVEKKAGHRLVDMLMAKVAGEPFETEMPVSSFQATPMPAAIKDISKSKVMIITDGGLVPRGNPDKIVGMAATTWGTYSIEGRDHLKGKDYEISHGGYDQRFVEQDPDRLVPLDALRELEREGAIGELHNEFISTSGLANPLSNTRRMGKEMVEKVRAEGVNAVILTST
jgi:betaine reductase